jgi:D-alanyl-lipoteichoic acid acyltransferase DltB (MBOAT superfamily)
MLFNSLQYLLFVVVVVGAFWALAGRHLARTTMLTLASWLFYMSWNPVYIWLIIVSTALDFCVGLGLGATEAPARRKAWLALSIVGNLGILGLFKYYNFFVDATGDTLVWTHGLLLSWFGLDLPGLLTATDSVPLLDVVLPAGISFYTFQTMSYSIDVYRRELEPSRSFIDFSMYVAFFPQLVAGPIVRGTQFMPQVGARPTITTEAVGVGLFLIAVGLVKKVAVADFVAVSFVDRVFDNPLAFTSVEVLVALYGYTIQIYCDFSGYSDVAIGTAMLMGFTLPENFDRPYMAKSPAEFWRRWHMSLSTWLRDYLYYPLGGSRTGPVRAYFNLFITFFLIGLWHGANWTFVLYGLLHGTAMVLHRLWSRTLGRGRDGKDDTLAITVFKIALCFHFTVLSRILFRSPNVDVADQVWTQLQVGTSSVAQVSWQVWAVMGITMLIHWTPKGWVSAAQAFFVEQAALTKALILAAVAAFLMRMSTGEVVPYIYFQF